jgi:long-chain fatty acid transport protein
MTRLTLLAATTAVAALSASQSQAAGFYLQEQSVKGTGRAYSGEVADKGVDSLWWNPASIARSGREAYLGMHAVFVDATVEDHGSTITYPGGATFPIQGEPRAFSPIKDGVAPNFAIATPIGDRFALGLSVATPYNFTTDYRETSWARYDALHSRLTTADVQLTGAMQVTDWLDLGVGVSAQYADAKLSTAYPNLSPLLEDGVSQLSGDGWDFGWNVGAQAHFGQVTLGASYRSKIEHDLDDRLRWRPRWPARHRQPRWPWLGQVHHALDRHPGRPLASDRQARPERPGPTHRLERIRRHQCEVRRRRRREPAPGL